MGRVADGCELPGKRQSACLTVDPKNGDIITALITAIEELSRGIEREAARIISLSPDFTLHGQTAVGSNRENGDAVMQAVPCIQEAAVRRDSDSRAEVAAGEACRESGNRLPFSEGSFLCVEVEKDDRRSFFLNGVQPSSIRVEIKVTRSVARRERNGSRFIRSQLASLIVEFPDENLVEAEVRMQDKPARRM